MNTLDRRELRHADGRRLWVYGELRGRLPAGEELGADYPPAGLHQRYDPLLDDWVALSPARNRRPNVAAAAGPERPASCPLCPGGPELPFSYQAAVFENRFPTFVAQPSPVIPGPRTAASLGRCEVVLYTESHTGSLATLSPAELARVVAIWRDRTSELWADERHRFVLTFENRGELVGATISHPHGQIYAFDRLPPLIGARLAALDAARRNGGCIACRLIEDDLGSERLLHVDDHVVVAVPFAARWPYEVHVRMRRHGLGRLSRLDRREAVSLAAALRGVVARYDRLFDFEMPYMMVVLEAPDESPGEQGGRSPAADWHLAVEFYPPQRNARQLKVRASVETATGMFINDTEPEQTTAELRRINIQLPGEADPPKIVSRP